MEVGMTGLTVLVVDDEPLARRRLTRLLGRLNWVERIEQATDVLDACRKTVEIQPDIMLLDIQMPGGSGFDVLERLESEPPVVVFVTAFDHHALRAFEANAVDQAMARAQSIVGARLQTDRIAELQETIASLKRALREQPRQTGEFWVKIRGEHLRVGLEKIIRFQAERDYVRIHVAGADYLYQETLGSLEQRLDSSEFIRVHRGAIVRIDTIVGIRPAPFAAMIAVLKDGSEIRIGRTYASSVREKLMRK
jgi:two-component system LytT family response regulator/two-component system response regulator AlgR